MVAAGRVSVDGRATLDPEHPTVDSSEILIDGQRLKRAAGIYLMVNKPRGLVTTAQDERGRPTVYRCFEGHELPWVAPVGRLDQASEGLLLFTNDPVWAAAITEPGGGCLKTYRVQVSGIPDAAQLKVIAAGARCDDDWLAADHVQLLRAGERTSWLEIRLGEGRNRHLRRLLAAFDLEVRRLIRVSIGPLALGELGKGAWRMLEEHEVAGLSQPAPATRAPPRA